MENKITRDALIEDIRELSNILETAHPDPYLERERIKKAIMLSFF